VEIKLSSICDVVRERAQEHPEGQAFRHLANFFGDEGGRRDRCCATAASTSRRET
jgi:hypothetical protein